MLKRTSCISTFSAATLLPTSKAYAGCFSCMWRTCWGFTSAIRENESRGSKTERRYSRSGPEDLHSRCSMTCGAAGAACMPQPARRAGSHPAVEVAGVPQVAGLLCGTVQIGGRPGQLVTVAGKAALRGVQPLQQNDSRN